MIEGRDSSPQRHRVCLCGRCMWFLMAGLLVGFFVSGGQASLVALKFWIIEAPGWTFIE